MNTLKKRSMIIFLSLFLVTAACAGGSRMTKKTVPSGGASGSAYVTDLSVEGNSESVEVVVDANNQIEYTAFQLKDPPRLILDMSQIDMSRYQAVIPVERGPVKSIRPYYFAGSNDSRLEIDLSGSVDYEIDNADPAKLRIKIAKKGAEKPSDGDYSAAAPSPGEPAPSAAEEAKAVMETMTVTDPVEGPAQVLDVKFSQTEGLSRIEITMSRPGANYQLIARDKLNRLTLDLPNAFVEQKDERLINVDLEDSKIDNVAVFQFRGGEAPVAKVVVNMEDMLLYNISSEDNKIILDIGDESVLALATKLSEKEQARLVTEEITGAEEPQYTGARISLDFQKADIHNILRILADVSGLNIITSDTVKGQVTMKLKDVPWDQALDVVLKNNGLDKIMDGNIIRVATIKEIQAEKEAQQKRQETEKQIEPLYYKIIEVNYESAKNMKDNLESLKSERGSVEINERTNTLIIKDTKAKIAEMESLVKKLDKKEQQVLIESRIVEVTHQKARELGIQWGGYHNSVTNMNFPATVGITGGTGLPSPNTGLGGVGVSLPTTATPTGAIGLTLGHVNGTALLDARLMALENSGTGRIVSMPKITTMNNKEAVIESGREIPYQTTSADGTKTEFKKATLSLKVTPHVTPDKHVRLEIQTNKDEADFANQLPGAPPPILTKQAKTEVLVKDGDTTVIGGLFKDNNQRGENKVPFFGDLPLLGWMFKSKLDKKSGEELLIFITPKIVE